MIEVPTMVEPVVVACACVRARVLYYFFQMSWIREDAKMCEGHGGCMMGFGFHDFVVTVARTGYPSSGWESTERKRHGRSAKARQSASFIDRTYSTK